MSRFTPEVSRNRTIFKRALLAEFSTKKTKTITVGKRKEAGSIVLVENTVVQLHKEKYRKCRDCPVWVPPPLSTKLK